MLRRMTALKLLCAPLIVVLAACGSDKGTATTVPPVVDTDESKVVEPELPIDTTVTGLSGQDIITRVKDCWAAGDAGRTDELAACYRDDARVSMVGFEPAVTSTGGAGAVQMFSGFGAAFPDLHHDIEIVLVNGNQVVVMALAQGTNTGSGMGLPATGKSIGLRTAQYLSLDDSGIAEVDEHYIDQVTMLGQLGQFPMTVRPVANDRRFEELVVASNSETEASNLAVLKKHGDAFNRHDVEDVMEHYAKGATFIMHASDRDRSGDEIGEALAAYYALSSDLRSSVEWMFAAGDYVVARLTVTGTNDGDFPGGVTKATNRTFTTDEMNVYRLEKGLIVEHHIFSNALQFATQLGLI
jgi:predicted ester cyclase